MWISAIRRDCAATPKLPVSEVGEDVRLDDARAAEMLGPEWRADDRKDGLALPRDGATLFLPPFARDSTNIEMALAGTEAGSKNAPILLSAAGTTVDLAVVASDKDGNMRLAGTVHLPRPRTVTELRVSPSARASRIRVVRFRFD